MSVIELEGLKFRVLGGGVQIIGTRAPGIQCAWSLEWKSVVELIDWLQIEVKKPYAPPAPKWWERCSQVDLSPEALTAAVWSGEGPPPVGCVCEATCEGDGWQPVKILARDGNLVIFRWLNGEKRGKLSEYGLRQSFRPLRTAEQLAAEAREAEVDRLCKVVMAHPAYQDHNRKIDCSAALRFAVEAIVDYRKFDADA